MTKYNANPISTCLIGYGRMGKILARNIAASHRFDLKAICDTSTRPDDDLSQIALGQLRQSSESQQSQQSQRSQRSQQSSPSSQSTPYYYGDYQELLERSDIDSVVIATPVQSHFSIAQAAMDRGRHVLVEKPATETAAEAAMLAHQASESGVVLFCDHTLLYEQAAQLIGGIIHDNPNNRVLNGVFSRRQAQPVNLDNARYCFDELAPHALSLADYFDGWKSDGCAISCESGNLIDSANLLVRLSSGANFEVRLEFTHSESSNAGGQLASAVSSALPANEVRKTDIKAQVVFGDSRPVEVNIRWSEIRDAAGLQSVRFETEAPALPSLRALLAKYAPETQIISDESSATVRLGERLPIASMLDHWCDAMTSGGAMRQQCASQAVRVMQLMDCCKAAADPASKQVVESALG